MFCPIVTPVLIYDDEKVEVKERRVILGRFLHLAQGGVPVEPNDHHVTHSPSFTVFRSALQVAHPPGHPGRSGPSLVSIDLPINDRPPTQSLAMVGGISTTLDRFESRHYGGASADLTFDVFSDYLSSRPQSHFGAFTESDYIQNSSICICISRNKLLVIALAPNGSLIDYFPARLDISADPPLETLTHISLNNFHKTLNNRPCRPLVNSRVGRPRPNNANTPSAAIISLAAVTIHQHRGSQTELGRTVSDVLLLNLSIGFHYPQGVADSIGDH
jgi:hypothetical protein